jgi:hypothetical protein
VVGRGDHELAVALMTDGRSWTIVGVVGQFQEKLAVLVHS